MAAGLRGSQLSKQGSQGPVTLYPLPHPAPLARPHSWVACVDGHDPVARPSQTRLCPPAWPCALSQRSLLGLLLLLGLLPGPLTRVRTTPGTSSTPSPRERTRALLRDSPLGDGWLRCVRAAGGRWGPSLARCRGRGPEHAELVGRLPHTTRGCPLHHLWMPFPFSVIPSLVGTPQPWPQLLLV